MEKVAGGIKIAGRSETDKLDLKKERKKDRRRSYRRAFRPFPSFFRLKGAYVYENIEGRQTVSDVRHLMMMLPAFSLKSTPKQGFCQQLV